MRRLATICFLLAAPGGPVPGATEPPSAETTIRMAPAPTAAESHHRMRGWHRTYRQRLSPVLREWELVARVARERPGTDLLAGCRRLDRALTRLAGAPPPPSPDPSVSLHLEQTLRLLTGAVDSCSQGAWFLTAWRLRQADDAWRELRRRLLLYDLLP